MEEGGETGRRLKIPRACTAERRRRSPRPPVVVPPLFPPHFHYINQNGIAFREILPALDLYSLENNAHA